MTLKLRPLGDRVVIEPLEQEERTEGGLFIPETAKEKPQKGTIIAVGEGRRDDDGKRIPMDVEVGQIILFAKYGGTEIKLDSQKLLILKESDVLAVLNA
jgi:chaperonin GroES